MDGHRYHPAVHLAPSWDVCAGAVVLLAVVAKAAKAVSWSGAAAGVLVGAAVSAGFGWPGLAVLGTFFVVGSVATKVGYAKKAARGAAEARGGARDWRNVVGKGGVAAGIAVWQVFGGSPASGPDDPFFVPPSESQWLLGALAAALADTLGTEIGSLSRAEPRVLPWCRRVPPGTPGAVSALGIVAGLVGSALVAGVGLLAGLVLAQGGLLGVIVGAGLAASLAESLAVGGAGWRAPGFVRNVLTTAVGACLAGCCSPQVVY